MINVSLPDPSHKKEEGCIRKPKNCIKTSTDLYEMNPNEYVL